MNQFERTSILPSDCRANGDAEMKDEERPGASRPGDLFYEHLKIDPTVPLTEAEFDELLQNIHREFLEDPETSYPAFEAISTIARHILRTAESEPEATSSVSVPWWVISIIGEVWKRYQAAPSGGTLGECAGLEGGGQGKGRVRDKTQTLWRNRLLARDVALLIERSRRTGKKLSVNTAIEKVAASYDLSESLIWKAWCQFGKQATEKLREAGVVT